jgi:hypothetical protein
MAGHQCYHCKQWVDEGEPHDCWTTTESALTSGLSEDLQDAYARLRETALEFGDQRVYASHNSIMFARKACYFFVRPKRHFLEVCVFLGRIVKAPQVRRAVATSKTKAAHVLHVRHRDEVEPPITDWIHEAYRFEDAVSAKRVAKKALKPTPKPARTAGRQAARKSTRKSVRAPAGKAARPKRR